MLLSQLVDINWLLAIAAVISIFCLLQGRKTNRSLQNAALAQVNEAQIDAALAQVRNREPDVPVPSQQNTQTPEETAFYKVRKGVSLFFLRTTFRLLFDEDIDAPMRCRINLGDTLYQERKRKEERARKRGQAEHEYSATYPLLLSPPVAPKPTVSPTEEREISFAVALLDPTVREGHRRYLEQQTRRRRRDRECAEAALRCGETLTCRQEQVLADHQQAIRNGRTSYYA